MYGYLRKQRLNTNRATETLSTFNVLQKHLHKEALKKESNKRSKDSQLRNSEKIQSMTLKVVSFFLTCDYL